MKNIITKENVEKIQFYQMPKAFFTNPKYTPMRCESKLAYMLMLDLLPLSIQNNWVNEKDEVFVKLSRTKLMELLNIRGTQKAAQVIKELEDKNLIVSKRPGLNKCNEIYLSFPEGQRTKLKPIPPTPTNKSNNKPSNEVYKSLQEVKDIIDNQLHLEDLKQKYDPAFVDEIINNIGEMYLNKYTQIGKENKPQLIIRGVIQKLQMHHIEHVIDRYLEITINTKILNPKRYIQTMIYNSIFETQTKTTGHIRYNFGY